MIVHDSAYIERAVMAYDSYGTWLSLGCKAKVKRELDQRKIRKNCEKICCELFLGHANRGYSIANRVFVVNEKNVARLGDGCGVELASKIRM